MSYNYTIDIASENRSHTKILKLVGRGKTVLEIGCATGYMTRYLKDELGCRVSCIEIDAQAAEKAKTTCEEMLVGDIEELDLAAIYEGRPFEVVIMADVLEHVKDAATVLSAVRGILRPEGYLLLSVPNGAHGSMALEIFDGKWQYRDEGLLDQTHLHFFDKDSLLSLLDESGFYVSRLQRVIIHPRDTEMKTPWDSYPREVTAYLEKVNPEFQTYQFVVKAYPTSEQGTGIALKDALKEEEEKVARLEADLARADGELASLRALERGFEAEFKKREKEYLESLERETNRLEEEKKSIRDGYESVVASLTAEKKEQQMKVRHFQLEAMHFGRENDRLNRENQGAMDELADLRGRLAEIEHSLFWRLVLRYRRYLDTFVPAGSRRRRLYQLFIRSLVVLFREGPASFMRRTAAFFRRNRGNEEPAVGGDGEWHPLEFPDFEEMAVSIVIPVYNQPALTYRCLASILARSTSPYEVIVVDNASEAETATMLERISGIRVIRNPDNRGFVEACNQGADTARGENILFLNNDTEVTEGWLEAMLAPLADDKVGMVGAKLVYPDGRLQEAGNIIFRDGTGWNYGRGDDPDLPQYSYLKEVDYCSGACLLIRRPLWLEVGGFDKRYAPAYYEDTDLCFSVRARGYRVVYQPEARIIHFEGATSGTDINKGFKRYQQVNLETFREKWRETLAAEHVRGSEEVYLGRERNRGRRVLVVDHYAPTFDKDSGSLRMFTLMSILLEMGYKVLFWPENRAYHPYYTKKLQQMGIETFYGDLDFGRYLEEYGEHIDVIILSRPQVAMNFIYAAKKFTRARILYDTVDLHFLREQRRAQVELAKAAREFKDMELFLADLADDVLVVSEVEKEVLEEEGVKDKVSLISNIHQVERMERPFADRKGLMFIGGFDHTPNEDGIVWFVRSILPKIREKIPNLPLFIVGSHPTEAVKALAGKDVTVTGYVEDIRPFFEQSRVFVCPLRYGAGVKGKIGQSMAYGLPVVMTPIGAEGMGVVDGENALVAEDEDAFAEKVARLYEDAELWEKLARGGIALIKRRFSPAVIKDALQELLEEKGDG